MIYQACEKSMTGPIAWGKNDCFISAGKVFFALWGHNPTAKACAMYHDTRSAVALVTRHGGLAEVCDALLTGVRQSDHIAPGSLLVIGSSDPLGSAMAIAINPKFAAAKTENGLALIRDPKVHRVFNCLF